MGGVAGDRPDPPDRLDRKRPTDQQPNRCDAPIGQLSGRQVERPTRAIAPEAQMNAAEAAVRALARVVAPLDEERKAKKAKQNKEALEKLKEATKAKKEAARAAQAALS